MKPAEALAALNDLPDACGTRWRAGLLQPIDAPLDGARCCLARNHVGEHDFRSGR